LVELRSHGCHSVIVCVKSVCSTYHNGVKELILEHTYPLHTQGNSYNKICKQNVYRQREITQIHIAICTYTFLC
jgi:hypothetical protein